MINQNKIKAIVISGYGINCETEMAHACKISGADVVDIAHLSDILHGDVNIKDYNFINLPGGFLDGDNLGAAQMCAHRIKMTRIISTGEKLIDQFVDVINHGGIMLGICNGFQLLVKLGLLPCFDARYGERTVSLTQNDSGRFEDRWVYCKINKETPCIFTKNMDFIELPVRHGEGKFVALNEETLKRLEDERLVVLKYANRESGEESMDYPENPNGSINSIAGICDPTGRIMGLMPHPEAFWNNVNHPNWTRKDNFFGEGMGLIIFKNAINFLREKQ
jgi:phosphoribosylformylglycinamidine synthase